MDGTLSCYPGSDELSRFPFGKKSRRSLSHFGKCHTRDREKAGAGIEPANSGFADRDLTTWLPRRYLEEANYPGVRRECQRAVVIQRALHDLTI